MYYYQLSKMDDEFRKPVEQRYFAEIKELDFIREDIEAMKVKL